MKAKLPKKLAVCRVKFYAPLAWVRVTEFKINFTGLKGSKKGKYLLRFKTGFSS